MRPITRFGMIAFLGVCLSTIPVNKFIGMTGVHWILGCPLPTAMLKYGTIEANEVEGWHIDFHYPFFVADVIIWVLILLLIVWCYTRFKQSRRRNPLET